MKKALLILFLFTVAFTLPAVFNESKAQTSVVSAAYTSNLLDTVTNAGTKYLIPASAISGLTKVLEYSVTITKISGTVAGSLFLQGSMDNTNWYTIGAASTPTDVASQTFYFKIADYGTKYTRIGYTGAGTMAASFAGKVLARR